MKPLTILYRGQLSSCNFDCGYCPFAKRRESREAQEIDRAALARFVAWVGTQAFSPTSVFFTPWGEALVRGWYRDAMGALSNMDHVRRVAVQTNLSVPVSWVRQARADRVGVWATWHPEQMPLGRFVARVKDLHRAGTHVSAGIVGMPEHEADAIALKAALPDVYVWVNAVKRNPAAMALDWAKVDPLFGWNAHYWPSAGKACRTGEDVVTVDGVGDVRRCHFVDQRIGNIYDGTIHAGLKPRACPKAVCGCHIGYVHMPGLGVGGVFGDGILERVVGSYG